MIFLFIFLLFSSMLIKTARTETGVWCRERWDFLPLVHEGRASEKNSGISTLQAAEPLTVSITVL